MRLSTALVGVIAAALLPLSAAAQNLFVFGDSLSDNGNFYAYANGTYPPPDQYWEGRASNGPVWSELIGFDLGQSPNTRGLVLPDDGFRASNSGINFAHYGATIDGRLTSNLGQNITRQARYFGKLASKHHRRISEDDIAVIWAGTNDYLAYGTQHYRGTVKKIKNSVTRIADAGIGYVFVMDLPGWHLSPYGYNRWDRSDLETLIGQHNSYLLDAINAERNDNGTNAYVIEISHLFQDVHDHPGAYGFSVVKPGTGTSGHCLGDGLVLDDCPDTYAFYDSLHPTTAMHAQIGDFVLASAQTIMYGSGISETAVAAASPAMTLQAMAVSGKNASNTAMGWAEEQSGAVTLFSYGQPVLGSAFQTEFNELDQMTDFELVGAHIRNMGAVDISFALSRGTPENRDLTGHPVETSHGWAVKLEHDWHGVDVGFEANGVEQSFANIRATGFSRDPYITTEFSQSQSLMMATAGQSHHWAGLEFTADLGWGLVRQDRSAVTETGETNLIARSRPEDTRLDEVGRARATVQTSGRGAGMDWQAGAGVQTAMVNGRGYSAWSLLGATQYSHTNAIRASEAVEASAFVNLANASNWALQTRLAIGEADGETVNSSRIELRVNW